MNSSHIIVGIRDLKANIIRGPYLMRTKAEFIRVIQDEAKNPQSDLAKFPNDFRLEIYGSWSENDAILDTHEIDSLGIVFDLINQN